MFRCLQKTRYPFAYVPQIEVSQTLEDGNIVIRSESSVRDIPSPENYALKNLLRAGVPIKEVNGLILESENVDLSNLAQSVETKPAETKPAETKPAETKFTETNSTTKETNNEK